MLLQTRRFCSDRGESEEEPGITSLKASPGKESGPASSASDEEVRPGIMAGGAVQTTGKAHHRAEGMTPHPDEEQVSRDTKRSFVAYPRGSLHAVSTITC
jgi:hypothetical protein